MSEKHTSGPWEVSGTLFGHNSVKLIYGPDGYAVADAGRIPRRSNEESTANARLIAAAPDLLKTLKNLLAHQGAFGAIFNAWQKEPGGQEKAHALKDQCKSAVAKATA